MNIRNWVVFFGLVIGAVACGRSASNPPATPSALPLPDAVPSASPAPASPSSSTEAPSATPPYAEGALAATPGAPASTLHAPPSPPLAALGPTTRGRIENFEQVGHHALGSRGWNAGLALMYPCAYVGNRNLPQIAIVDVSDPSNPVLAGELPLPPGRTAIELRAVPDLGLLVALTFSPDLSVLTFDARDCLRPQPLGSLGFGAAPHEFFLWRDPRRPERLLLYAAMWGGAVDLQVVDLTDPAAPRRLGAWSAAAEGASGPLHSLSLSRDGGRAYLALWGGGFLVADASDFAAGTADPQLRLARDSAGFAPLTGANVHSAVRLDDPRYVLLIQEVYACPFAGLTIADISNEARPRVAGRFDLPENDPACEALPQADAVFTAHNPLVVGGLAFVTWYGGGLQALDLSDPAQPRRAGQFVPAGEGAAARSYVGSYPVQLWSYPILREGLIYVSDIQSGLYVLRYTGLGAEAVGAVTLAEGNVTVLP